jgi:dephospho-CoA kinase
MLIGIVGALGAGKGTVVERLKEKGFRHYSASGYLKEVVLSQGGVPGRDAYSAVATEIRNADEAGLAKLLHEQYTADGGGDAVIEALHDVGEAAYIKEIGGVLLGIDADIQIRYNRAIARGSEKDNVTFEEFKSHIEREENGGGHHNIRAALKLADYTIMNDGTIEELQEAVDAFLQNYI